MKIYLIRHGETEGNVQKKYLGVSHSPFTDAGIIKNAENITRLSDIKFDVIYTSPSQRCLTIASDFGEKICIAPIVEDNLMELNFGIFENLTWQQAHQNYRDEFDKWCEDTYGYSIPEGESQKNLDQRVNIFINELKKSDYNNIAIFSHGGTIMSIASNLLRLDSSQKWHFKILPGSILVIEIKDDFAYLIL